MIRRTLLLAVLCAGFSSLESKAGRVTEPLFQRALEQRGLFTDWSNLVLNGASVGQWRQGLYVSQGQDQEWFAASISEFKNTQPKLTIQVKATWIDSGQKENDEGSSEIGPGETIMVIHQTYFPDDVLSMIKRELGANSPSEAIIEFLNPSRWKYDLESSHAAQTPAASPDALDFRINTDTSPCPAQGKSCPSLSN